MARLQGLATWSMVIFGALAAILGIIGLINPETTLSLLNFEVLERGQRASGDFSLTFLVASSMASLNMGVYYLLNAWNNYRPFYRWTVPFRILTFTMFTLAVVQGIAPVGFMGVAVWELAGALFTGFGLWWDARRAA